MEEYTTLDNIYPNSAILEKPKKKSITWALKDYLESLQLSRTLSNKTEQIKYMEYELFDALNCLKGSDVGRRWIGRGCYNVFNYSGEEMLLNHIEEIEKEGRVDSLTSELGEFYRLIRLKYLIESYLSRKKRRGKKEYRLTYEELFIDDTHPKKLIDLLNKYEWANGGKLKKRDFKQELAALYTGLRHHKPPIFSGTNDSAMAPVFFAELGFTIVETKSGDDHQNPYVMTRKTVTTAPDYTYRDKINPLIEELIVK